MNQNYHRIKNFSEDDSYFKKFLAHLIFFIASRKIKYRKNLLTKKEYRQVLACIKRGDLILAGTLRRVSRFLIKGLVTHSALYLGRDKIIHVIVDGVEVISLEDLFLEYDYVVVLRPNIEKNKTKVINKAIAYMRAQIGKPYDFDFEYKDNKFFCSELITSGFVYAGFDLGIKKNKSILDKIVPSKSNIIYPVEFLSGNFEIIYLSSKIYEEEGEIYLKKEKF